MKKTEIASASPVMIEDVADTAQWIEIMPLGRWFGQDGRGPYSLRDAETVIQNSRRPKTDLPIDREHQRFHSPKGTPIPAAGWMKDFQIRDTSIWALVDWTPAAREQLRNKEFRYFSPEFIFDKNTGDILKITGGTLTIDPNFELAAVASQEKPSDTQNPKETKMDEHLKKLAAALGLKDTATTHELSVAAQEKLDALQALQAQTEQLKTQVEAASQERQPDPTKYVPIDQYKAVASQLSSLQEKETSAEVSQAVEIACRDGKVVPANKDWATAYASKDLDGFKEYMKTAPVIVKPGEKTYEAKTKEAASQTRMNDVQAQIASNLRIDPKVFAQS